MLEGRTGQDRGTTEVSGENRDRPGTEFTAGRRGRQVEVKVVA